MIDFDQELKKFHRSLEVEEVEDAIYGNNIPDMTDIMLQIMNEIKNNEQ